MLTFLDTETTGLRSRPFIVQLAALLTEDDGTPRAHCNFIIKPEGYTEIPKDASDIHGITTDLAMKAGVPIAVAIGAFNNFVKVSNKLIAHNIKFDCQMIDYAYERGPFPSRLEGIEKVCTMEMTKRKVKLPPTPGMLRAGIRDYKPPRLEEVYKFAFGKNLENAHDALADVEGCKDVYFWALGPKQESSIIEPTQEPPHDNIIRPVDMDNQNTSMELEAASKKDNA